MPRNIITSLRRQLETPLSKEVDLAFVTIRHPTLDEAIRVVWDTKDFIFGGDFYIGFPFDIQILSDEEGPPKAQLQIQNIDPRIGDTIRGLTTPATIDLEMVSSSDYDLTADPRTEIDEGATNIFYAFYAARLVNVKVDFLTVTADIVGWDYLQRVWPGKRATQDIFAGLFR